MTDNMMKENVEIVRPLANFHPSIWGDYFLYYTFDHVAVDASMQEIEILKEEVRKTLKTITKDTLKEMTLIDELQRLGLAYHFQVEIEEAMKQLYDTFALIENDSLHSTSLYFRLLRQEGHRVSSDIFTKFKDDKGVFNENLVTDVKTLLSLYEATHLRVHGENILEEALAFTTTNLSRIATRLSPSPLQKQVQHALEQPLHKGMPRLEARRYISWYEENETWSNALLRLAKMDFNVVQALHRKELSEISKWWKDLDVPTNLPFIRDRVAEGYFWIVGVYFEPHFSLARMILTKIIGLASIIDDIYDAYGTFEELQIFTDAIDRWDATAMDRLPEYMKVCYQALLNVYDQVEGMMDKEGRSYHVHYAKEAMKDVARAYLVEATWRHEGYVPTVEEYIQNALISCGYKMLTISSFLGMECLVSKEDFDWVRNNPKLLRASSVICRLMDDVVSHKFEQVRGHVASAVECYMKQHGVSEEEAVGELNKIAEEAWKDLNEGYLSPTKTVPMPLLLRTVNLARMIYVIHKKEDGYTHSHKLMKEYISLLFVNPAK